MYKPPVSLYTILTTPANRLRGEWLGNSRNSRPGLKLYTGEFKTTKYVNSYFLNDLLNSFIFSRKLGRLATYGAEAQLCKFKSGNAILPAVVSR